jgi:hypothetical protein
VLAARARMIRDDIIRFLMNYPPLGLNLAVLFRLLR